MENKDKAERDEAIAAIIAFCARHSWADKAWKEQPWIAKLFELAEKHKDAGK